MGYHIGIIFGVLGMILGVLSMILWVLGMIFGVPFKYLEYTRIFVHLMWFTNITRFHILQGQALTISSYKERIHIHIFFFA